MTSSYFLQPEALRIPQLKPRPPHSSRKGHLRGGWPTLIFFNLSLQRLLGPTGPPAALGIQEACLPSSSLLH